MTSIVSSTLHISKGRSKGEAAGRRYTLETIVSSDALSMHTQAVQVSQPMIPKARSYKLVNYDTWLDTYRQFIAHVYAYIVWHLASYDANFVVSTKEGESALFDSLARYMYDHSSCAMRDYKFFK